MKLFFALILMLSSICASAVVLAVDTSNLTSAQISKLQADASAIAAQNIAAKENGGLNTVLENPEEVASFVSTWGLQTAAAAEGFAKALGVAAHELNINVNEFLNTPAGKLTAFIILWKVMGESALDLCTGLLLISLGLYVGRWFILRALTNEIKLVESTWFWGLYTTSKPVRIYKNLSDMSSNDDSTWSVFVTGIVIIGLGVVAGTILLV